MFERISDLFRRKAAPIRSRESWGQYQEGFRYGAGPAALDSLTLDDMGWESAGGTLDLDLPHEIRRHVVQRARVCWRKDPLAKQAVRLWTDYSLGSSGVKFKAKDASIDALLQKAWKNPLNNVVFGYQGQRKSSTRLLVDGEIFFVLFGDGPETLVRRIADPLQITRILYDPDDSERPLFYRRDFAEGNKFKTIYYPAISGAMFADIPDVTDDGKDVRYLADLNTRVIHVPFEPLGTRGNSLLATTTPWSNAHWDFMDSRVRILKSLAEFAWKMKAKGGTAALNAIRSQAAMRTPYNTDGTIRQPGGTWLENQALELTAMPRDTGAGNAKNDGDQIKLMVCAGTGIMQHYFGDPSTGNLATATAMELPMLKMFESYQQLWAGAYQEIFQHISGKEEGLEVDIDFPPMLSRDINNYADGVTKFNQAVPGLADSRSVLMQILMTLGINNADEEVDAIIQRAEQIRAEQREQDEIQAKNQRPVPNGTKQKSSSEADTEEGLEGAVDDVLLALSELRDCL